MKSALYDLLIKFYFLYIHMLEICSSKKICYNNIAGTLMLGCGSTAPSPPPPPPPSIDLSNRNIPLHI